MLQVTPAATNFLAAVLEEAQEEPLELLRLILTDEGVTLVIDNKTDDDQVFAHEGKDVLIVSPDVAQQLDGRTLDAHETDDAIELTLD